MVNNFVILVAHCEELLHIKSHDPLIILYFEFDILLYYLYVYNAKVEVMFIMV